MLLHEAAAAWLCVTGVFKLKRVLGIYSVAFFRSAEKNVQLPFAPRREKATEYFRCVPPVVDPDLCARCTVREAGREVPPNTSAALSVFFVFVWCLVYMYVSQKIHRKYSSSQSVVASPAAEALLRVRVCLTVALGKCPQESSQQQATAVGCVRTIIVYYDVNTEPREAKSIKNILLTRASILYFVQEPAGMVRYRSIHSTSIRRPRDDNTEAAEKLSITAIAHSKMQQQQQQKMF